MKCVEGCVCGRHARRMCIDGCTCSRHPVDRPYRRADDYFNNHRTVRAIRGSAATHECATCCQAARHWAIVHGEDGTDPWRHYMPMCVSCHHSYDQIHERAGMHGKKHTEEAKRRMSESRKGKSWLHEATPEQREAFGDAVRRGKAAS